GQKERRQVVDGNRQFVAVLGQLKVRADESGIVDQQIDAVIVGEEGVCESAHRGDAGQIGKRGLNGAGAGALGDESVSSASRLIGTPRKRTISARGVCPGQSSQRRWSAAG